MPTFKTKSFSLAFHVVAVVKSKALFALEGAFCNYVHKTRKLT